MLFKEFVQQIPDFLSLSQKEQVKIMCYYISVTSGIDLNKRNLTSAFVENGLPVPSNIPRELTSIAKSPGKCIIKRGELYYINSLYQQEMDKKYGRSVYHKNTTKRLSDLLEKITSQNQRNFLRDAIACFNNNLFRPAIIMSWMLVMDILFDHVIESRLTEFNDQMKAKNKKRLIIKKEDFEELKESEIIEMLRGSNIITKEQKKILSDKLDIRNSAAHPNSTTFQESKVSTFIEEIVEDVISKIPY